MKGTYVQRQGDNECPCNDFEKYAHFAPISRHFYYFGDKTTAIPERFDLEKKGPGSAAISIRPISTNFSDGLKNNPNQENKGILCVTRSSAGVQLGLGLHLAPPAGERLAVLTCRQHSASRPVFSAQPVRRSQRTATGQLVPPVRSSGGSGRASPRRSATMGHHVQARFGGSNAHGGSSLPIRCFFRGVSGKTTGALVPATIGCKTEAPLRLRHRGCGDIVH